MDIDAFKANHSILSVLSQIGVSYPHTEGTFAIKCLFHEDHNPSMMVMPTNNRYECKSAKCGEKGDLLDLVMKTQDMTFAQAVQFIDPSQEVETESKPSIESPETYFFRKGFNLQWLKDNGVDWDEEKIKINLGWGTKVRTKERKWFNPKGKGANIYKPMETDGDKIILAEGEMDALSICYHTGLPAWTNTAGANTWKDEWSEQFEQFNRIYIAYDNDIDGNKGAIRVAKSLGEARCVRVQVPVGSGKDWGDYFPKHTANEFSQLLKKAKPMEQVIQDYKEPEESSDVPQPFSLLDITKEYFRYLDLKKNAPSTGFTALDKIIGGVVPGSLITITGNTNVGKTTFASNVAINLSRQDKKVLYLAFEPRVRILSTLASIYLNKPYQIVENDINQITEFAKKNPCIDYYDKRSFKNFDEVVKAITSIGRYDCIILDHMGYFTTDGSSMTQSEADVINKLASAAWDNETAIVNIAHTNKQALEKGALSLVDLKGSTSIPQDSTDVIVLEREQENTVGFVKVLKTKNGALGAFKAEFMVDSGLVKQVGDRISLSEAIETVNEGNVHQCKQDVLKILQEYGEMGKTAISDEAESYGHKPKITAQAIDLMMIAKELKKYKGKYFPTVENLPI